MKSPNYTFWIIMSIIVLIMIYMVYHIRNNKVDPYWDYYEATEQLLDKAYDMNPTFMDSLMKTHEYYEYEQCRELLQ